MPLNAVWSIAAALAGAVLWVSPAGAGASSPLPSAASSSAPEPLVAAQTRIAHAYDRADAPPALFARAVVPATPVVAMKPVPAPAVVAQGGIVRAVTPGGSQPSMWWVIVIGIVCCRVGARVLRVS